MASEILGGHGVVSSRQMQPLPHVTTVNIADSDAAILNSMYRLSNEILHHKWLLRQR